MKSWLTLWSANWLSLLGMVPGPWLYQEPVIWGFMCSREKTKQLCPFVLFLHVFSFSTGYCPFC